MAVMFARSKEETSTFLSTKKKNFVTIIVFITEDEECNYRGVNRLYAIPLY